MTFFKPDFPVLAKHIRKVNAFESAYLSLQARKLYPNLSLTVRYNKPLDRALLSIGLKGLLAKDPLYSSNVFQVGDVVDHNWSNFHVRPVAKVRFEDVVHFSAAHDFGGAQLNELGERVVEYNEEKPFWRILVQETAFEQYLSVIFNRALADPIVAQRFHIELLKQISEASAGLTFQEELFDYEAIKDELPHFEPQSTDVIDVMDKTTFKALQSSVTQDVLQGKTVHEIVSLSQIDTEALKRFCDNHQAAPIALLSVMLNKAVHASLAEKRSQLAVGSVIVSGSTYYPDMGDELKFQLVVHNHLAKEEDHTSIAKEDVVDAVEQFSSSLNQELTDKESSKSFGFRKYLGPQLFESSEEVLEENKFIEVADIGALVYKHEGWDFEDAYFSKSLGPHSLVGINVLAVNQGLRIVLCVNEEYATEFESLATSFKASLAQIIDIDRK